MCRQMELFSYKPCTLTWKLEHLGHLGWLIMVCAAEKLIRLRSPFPDRFLVMLDKWNSLDERD